MKNPLLSLIVLSATLFCQTGGAAELAQPIAHSQMQQAVVHQMVVVSDALPPTPQLQLASIGDGRSMLSGSLQAASRTSGQPAGSASVGRLPSTPIALACLVLVICILVGRRSADTLID